MNLTWSNPLRHFSRDVAHIFHTMRKHANLLAQLQKLARVFNFGDNIDRSYYTSHVMRKPVYANANNKVADQPVHPRSLISTFVVRCLDSIISVVSLSEI